MFRATFKYGREVVWQRTVNKIIVIGAYYHYVDNTGIHNSYCKVGCGSLKLIPSHDSGK